jgi:hypothetical protein
MLTTRVGTPVQGELLAGRYRLDECLAEYPRTQRTLWRGTDQVLARKVAVELRVPGGSGSEDFLTAAMTVARIVHPAVIGVYDAVDEGERAYIVREWVHGTSFASSVREAPFAPDRAAAVVRSATEGVAALHAAGVAHGNLNPNSVIVDGDDKVTLTDLRSSDEASTRADIRALGALLYSALTGHWPTEVPSPQPSLPDAVRSDGRVCSPRQVRAGIPAYLDALAMDLLDPALPPPSAADLVTELRRFDVEAPDAGVLDAIPMDDAPRGTLWGKIAIAAVAITLCAVFGWLLATTALSSGIGRYPSTKDPTEAQGNAALGSLRPVPVADAQILDPGGDGTELGGAELAVDGKRDTAWQTQDYTRPHFGGIPGKTGMGVRVDLGREEHVSQVTVRLNAAGSSFELRSGPDSEDPAAFRTVGDWKDAADSVTFDVPEDVTSRYWLLWITSLPPKDGRFGVEVQEITFSR